MGAEVYLCIEVTNISIGAPPALGIVQHTTLPPPPPMVAGDCHIMTTNPGHHSHEEKTNRTALSKRRPLNPFASVPDEEEDEDEEEEGSR